MLLRIARSLPCENRQFLRRAKGLHRIRWLSIDNTFYTPGALFAKLTHLEHIFWVTPTRGQSIRPPFWRAIGRLRRLKSVVFIGPGRGAARIGIRALAELPALKKLTLYGGLSSKGCRALSTFRSAGRRPFPRLEELNITPNSIDATCVSELKRLPRLKDLRIGVAKLGSGALAQIAGAKQLQVLDLDRSTWPKTESLSALLPKLKHLRRLCLSRGQLDAAGIAKAQRLGIKLCGGITKRP
jgi:hypothetical protein